MQKAVNTSTVDRLKCKVGTGEGWDVLVNRMIPCGGWEVLRNESHFAGVDAARWNGGSANKDACSLKDDSFEHVCKWRIEVQRGPERGV